MCISNNFVFRELQLFITPHIFPYNKVVADKKNFFSLNKILRSREIYLLSYSISKYPVKRYNFRYFKIQ